MFMVEKTITEFLSNEYRDYAIHTIESRAIPHFCDGLKPVNRKIIYGSLDLWKTGNEKPVKVFQLGGTVGNKALYHNGSESLNSAIINMAQSFKNNLPLFVEFGQFGSLRSPQAGAPRYIGTKLSDYFRLIYKDNDLLKYKEEEGYIIEPEYYLPVIPMILINGSPGIAVGFTSKILNRDPKEVVKACASVLQGKKIKEVSPKVNEFNGTFEQDVNNHKCWYINGKFERKNTYTVHVTEIPISFTYDKYEQYLDKLVDNKTIVSYEDNSSGNVSYMIKFKRGELSDKTDEEIIKILSLRENYHESLSTLDENGELKIFDRVSELIEYFVKFRLTFYDKRKQLMIDKHRRELSIMSNRGRFIKAILDGKIEINNKKKDDIISDIEKVGIDKVDDSYDYLLRMPIYSLTQELYNKLKKDFIEKKTEMEKIELLEPRQMYLDDLKEIIKNI